MTESSLIVEHVSKRYYIGKPKPALVPSRLARVLPFVPRPQPKKPVREIWALKDVSFEVGPGTILGIIGVNGAGKSTLLKIIGRITSPTEGRVVGRGRVVPLLERGIGFQSDMTGRENILLNAALYGIPRSEAVKRIDQIADFAELRDFLDTPVKRYSSGMYVRLAFSVAVNLDPDIILADEILAVGDIAFQERCLERVRQAGEQGATILFVSHDMAAIRRLCHRVIWLHGGRIVEDGDPDQVVSHYEKKSWSLLAQTAVRKGASPLANPYGEIIAVRLLSPERKELGAARISEDVILQTTFRIRESGVFVRAAFDVYTRGVHAFRSVQPIDQEITEPGIFSASARIPAHLLADTIYTVNASVTIVKDNQEHPLVDYGALSFQAYSTDAPTPDTTAGIKLRLAGAVSPRLEWDFLQERDVVTA